MNRDFEDLNRYHQQVVGALLAASIVSATRYLWYTSPSLDLPRAFRKALAPEMAREYLLATLASRLYTNLYCTGGAQPSDPSASRQSSAFGTSAFARALSDANEGSGHWEDGWSVSGIVDDEISLTRDGLEMRIAPDDAWAPDIGSAIPAKETRVRFPKEMFGWSPGFYLAASNVPFPGFSAQGTARLYWNLQPSGAVPLVKSVTQILNGEGVPFKLKVINDPSRFDRCDAGVLYIAREDVGEVFRLIGRIYSEVNLHLSALVPAFTRPLAAGVGYADDPGGGQSFGAHRCHLLADGIIQAHEKGVVEVTDRLECVRQRFLQEGIVLDAPFTDRKLLESAEIGIFCAVSPPAPTRRSDHLAPDRERKMFLDSSYEIGRRIAQQAIWHHDRCNWLGAISGDELSSGSVEKSSTSLGPELYSGCSGIALFLAELACKTGDRDLHSTAIAAMNQALMRSSVIPSSSRSGLYTGWVGVALAGVRVGLLLDHSLSVERSKRLLRRAIREFRQDMGFDLISGQSGAIVGLLSLWSMLADDSMLDCAVRLGNMLIDSAEVTSRGWSWKAAPLSFKKNLTGLSHGAAGAGLALLELASATGDSHYRAAAESAFRYERSFYDNDVRNWPDFRTVTPTHRSHRLRVFSCTWCHGAPGIGLSRLRGYQLFQDEMMKNEALVALTTTREIVQDNLRTSISNYALCHGLAGNAEILSYGCQVLGEGRTADAELVRQVAHAGIRAYCGDTHRFPYATHANETPDLMLGLAGLGFFFLRLHDHGVSSPLLLQPETLRIR